MNRPLTVLAPYSTGYLGISGVDPIMFHQQDYMHFIDHQNQGKLRAKRTIKTGKMVRLRV